MSVRGTLYLWILLSCLPFCMLQAQPIAVSEIISENRIANFGSQQLILVDFWATWCVPCIPANEQLEVIQEKYSSQIFMISLTDEPAERVRSHLQKRNMNLMVAIDDEHYTTDKYEVKTRPFAIILNREGKLVWKGHPADLEASTIEKLCQENPNRNSIPLDRVVEVRGKTAVPNEVQYEAELSELESIAEGMIIQPVDSDAYQFYRNDSVVLFQGKISEALQQILSLTRWEIDIPSGKDRTIRLLIQRDLWDKKPDLIIDRIKDLYALDIRTRNELIEAYLLEVNKPRLLWDRYQLDLGGGTPEFITGDDRLQGDNATIAEVCRALGEILDFPVFYEGNDREEYDWDFQFRYENLMKEELEDSFGIVLEKKWAERVFYKIR